MKYLLKAPGIHMESTMKSPLCDFIEPKHYTHRPPGRCLVFITKVVTTHRGRLKMLRSGKGKLGWGLQEGPFARKASENRQQSCQEHTHGIRAEGWEL